MLGYWSYTSKHFLYICIFTAFALKTRYSKCEINIFYNIYKKIDHKINLPENHKSLSLFFFILFFLGWVQLDPCGWAGPSQRSRVTRRDQ
jgi:hypothetical protein